MMTVGEAVDEYLRWIAAQRRHSTLIAYRSILRLFVREYGTRPVRDIRPYQVDLYAALRSPRVSARFVAQELRVLHAMFRVLQRWEMVEANPVEKEAFPRVPRKFPKRLSNQDVETLLARVDTEGSPSLRGAVYMGLYTGARRGEIFAAEWDDIKDGWVLIRNKAEHWVKDGCDRAVPLNQKLADILGEMPRTARWCFPSVLGNRFDVARAGRLLAALGCPGFHMLRREFAGRCLRSGIDIRTLQRWLGHSSLSITELYLPVSRPDEALLIQQIAY